MKILLIDVETEELDMLGKMAKDVADIFRDKDLIAELLTELRKL